MHPYELRAMHVRESIGVDDHIANMFDKHDSGLSTVESKKVYPA